MSTTLHRDKGLRGWAGNICYSATCVARPADLDALRRTVAENPHAKALGSRKSFNGSADTTRIQISLEAMPAAVQVDTAARSVTSSAGVSRSDLSVALHSRGLAMADLASLPQFSVDGAIQTGTTGSGVGNAGLSAAVNAVEIVDADGEIRHLARGHEDFDAVVGGLGAFGVVHAVTQDVVDAFDVEQSLFSRFDLGRVLGAGGPSPSPARSAHERNARS